MKKIFILLTAVLIIGSIMNLPGCSSGGGGSSDGHNTEPATFSITGQIISNNTGLSGISVSLSGARTAQTTTDSNGQYSFTGLANGNYTITPSLSGYVFSPSGKVVTINGTDEAGVDFTATASTTPTYTISGTVSGAAASGVTITLTGAGASATTTDSSGNYSFSNASNGNYIITPSKAGYTFNPTSRSITVNGANVTGQNFIATASTTPTYIISGTVNGAVLSGVTITMSGIGSSTTTTDANGNYSLGGAANGSYTITPAMTGYTFSPASRTITVNGANITGQNFTSTANVAPTYSISGTVSACLTDVTVTLTGTGSVSTTTDSNGNYNFSGAVNGSYTITPSKNGYIFNTTSKNITINGSNITGQNFTVATAPSGSLDLTFGTCGIVTTNIGSMDNIEALGIQSDGKIVAAGHTTNDLPLFAVVRYNANGSLDSSFGTGGIVTTPVGSNSSYSYALGIQSDGKIVVAGSSHDNARGITDFALVRYNTNGSLDSSFGTGGIVTTPVGSNSSYSFALGIQSDGKIISAGLSGYDFCIVRYNTNGSLDLSFGTDGKVTTNVGSGFDSAYALGIQSDGKIIVTGQTWNGSNHDFALVRYNTNGSLDSTFGTGGIVKTDIGGNNDYAVSLGIQSDGKIVAAGSSNNGVNNDFALVRYNTNGSLDSSFGTGGKVTTDINNDDVAESHGIQSNGMIVVAGISNNGVNNDFALVRYNTHGSRDLSFGTSGKVTLDNGNNDIPHALDIQPDGKIVVAGSINDAFALVRYLP